MSDPTAYLTKRAWDRRILHVDLAPAMRAGDVPDSIESVVAEPISGEAIGAITDISIDGTAVSFLIAGGTPGGFYRIVIRFQVASQPGQMIEGVTGLKIDQ